MNIAKTSGFKDPSIDLEWLNQWIAKAEKLNNKRYSRHNVVTSLGKTCVFGLNTDRTDLDTLVIFPGARTSVLFWDADNNLEVFKNQFRAYLIETNGLPNLSDGATPDIKGDGYGIWANEVLDQLGIESAVVAGASFGGLITMKLGITNPEKIKSAFLFNPGCLQPFSMKWKNLYANILPIVAPSEKNIRKFLDTAVFSKPEHSNSKQWEQHIVDYEKFALTRFKDRTQKPYYMATQLDQVQVETHLILGDKDLLFPFEKSRANAERHLKNLKSIKVFPNVGHGIETYLPATKYLLQLVQPTEEVS